MTARQQIARLLPLVLLVVLVIAGLRGTVTAPGWNGPLKQYGVPIGIGVEVILIALMLVVRSREALARRAGERQLYTGANKEIEPPEALRFALRYVLGACIVGIGVVLVSNLHFHFFNGLRKFKPPRVPRITLPKQKGLTRSTPWTLHIPWGPIMYGLLIAALVAAVAISIWWSTRLRRPAAPLVIEDVSAGELREAVESGRAALAEIDDARAAIIACYLAMERSLAAQGTARTVADTPDELLARAVAAGVVRGGAASRLTALFYEARFSTHPVSEEKRTAASAALAEISGELAAYAAEQEARAAREAAARAAAQSAAAGAAGGQQGGDPAVKPGGGWV